MAKTGYLAGTVGYILYDHIERYYITTHEFNLACKVLICWGLATTICMTSSNIYNKYCKYVKDSRYQF